MKHYEKRNNYFTGVGILSLVKGKYVTEAKNSKGETQDISFTQEEVDELRAKGVIGRKATLVDGAQYVFSTNNDVLAYIRPASGIFIAKFAGFERDTRDEDNFKIIETTKTYDPKKGPQTSRKFVASFKVVGTKKSQTPGEGFTYPVYLPFTNSYNSPVLVNDGEGYVATAGDITKSPKLAQLVEMWDAMGMSDIMVEYSKDPNVLLGNMEDAIAENGQKVEIKVVDGYISQFRDYVETVPAPEPVEEKKPAPAKASRFDEE